MSLRVPLSATAIAAVFVAATPAVAQSSQTQGTVTATGTGQAAVHPANRHSNASIAAAVDAARRAAIKGAMNEAREYATDYANAAGLTLGSVISVSDQQSNGFYGFGGPGFFGPFGPNQFCGTIQRPIGKVVRGTKPRFKKVHRCFVPPFAYTTLTVTYSAS